MSDDSAPDVLGLRGTLPGPGWAALDAARNQRFTGELVAEAESIVRVYFDRGRIYVAERASDPPLGTRLVEAGALNAAQLQYGALRVGDIEHLGRLFDRVPSVNRDGVLVLNELMTEECVRWLAGQEVRSVTATPYRHHRSGMHRWDLFEPGGGSATAGSVPEMALPAPDPAATPVIAAPPADDSVQRRPSTDRLGADRSPTHTAPMSDDAGDDLYLDDVVAWNEPSTLGRVRSAESLGSSGGARRRGVFADVQTEEWIDQLDHAGVADADVGSASTGTSRLAPLPIRPVEEFELIWPSGETADVVDPGDVQTNGSDPDRTGLTARVPTERSNGPDEPAPHDDSESGDETPAAPDEPSQLAVRRAVATIDTGSLEARRRLVDVSSDTTPPGRLVVQRESSVWRSDAPHPTTSVFDEQPVPTTDSTTGSDAATTDDHNGRSSALRRLIGSLRRS